MTSGRPTMSDNFEYISHARVEYRDGYRHAYLGEVAEPVIYGVQGGHRQYYGAKEGPPIASTLHHIVAAVASFKATVDGRISGIGKTIRIKSIHVHYDLTVPAEDREAAEPALGLHPACCPAHQSVKDAIEVAYGEAIHL